MKRVLWILLTPAILLLLVGMAFDKILAPKILNFANQKIESISKNQGPFTISIETSKLQYFPPGIVAEKVTLKPKKKLSTLMSDIEIQSARAELALFQLITGKLKVGLIEINSPQVQMNFQLKETNDDSTDFSDQLDWTPIFEQIQSIPIEQVLIKDLNMKVLERKEQFSVSLYPTDVQLLQLPNLIQAKLSIPNMSASWDKRERLKTELNLVVVATPKSLRFQKFEVKNQTLDFNLSGEMKNKKGKKLEAQILWSGFLNLSQARDTLEQIFPEKKFPNFSGELKANGSWNPLVKDLLRADFNLQTQQIKVGNFSIGDASVKGKLTNRNLSVEHLQVEHPAGRLELHDTKLGLGEGFPLSSKVDLKSLDLQKLFQSLNLKTIPVEALASGYAPCQGRLRPLEFNCEFETKVQNVQVRSGYPKSSFEIVSLAKAQAQGQVKINLDAVSFDGKIQMGKSKGTTTGKVEYTKGFDIKFAANSLHWEDIKNLSSLNLTGVAELTGETRGDSKSAIFFAKAKAREQAVDNFHLGDLQLDIGFEKGQLALHNINGKIDKTEYAGQVDIHLREKAHLSGELTSQQANLKDIKTILEKRIPIPIAIEGVGPIHAKVSGPLNFWALNAEVTGRFSQPLIATEIFNDLIVDIEGKEGLYTLRKVEANRSAASLSISGTLSPQQELKLQGNLRNALLEESDMLARIGWPLSGRLNAQMKLEGTIENPDLLLNGQFSDMILDENEVANSNFKFHIRNYRASAEGAFFGHQIQTSLEWPIGEKGIGETSVRMKTQDWDYTPWLSLFNAGAINEETQGRFSSDVNLYSRSGRWNDLSGDIKIQNLMIARHDLVLENSKPIAIQARNGVYDLHGFLLKSPQKGKVEITGQNIRPENLNLQINASSDLKLAQIFVPLFEEISGPIDFHATVGGPWDRPQMIGQMNITNGYFRLKGFPHAFEKMQVDTTFSQTRILFNEIQGQLGGGTLKGEGSLQIQGPEDVPVLIRLRAQDISLNVPDQVKTKGDAELTFSGRWFPYVLGGTYRINSTLVEMNFGGQNFGAQTKQNIYLPQNLKEKIASPLELDLQLQFQKPLQIKNNLMEAQATGALNIKGSPTQPILLGQLKALKGSYLFFKDKPFEVQSASIQFQNPTEINPDLFITAQTRIEEYDVSLLVQGSSKEPNIRLSSQPPLSENDLTSLLALGVTSSKLQTVDSKEQQTQTANEVFAAAFQSTGVAKKVQSATGFNVQLSNSFDTTRNISVPKFTVSRKLNKKTNASVAFPVTGDQKTPEGRIEYNLNENLSINGSYETRKFEQSTTIINQRETPSILGLDLEFKKEFR